MSFLRAAESEQRGTPILGMVNRALPRLFLSGGRAARPDAQFGATQTLH
jgi:hypothetical protein